jgi:hypothetical protein
MVMRALLSILLLFMGLPNEGLAEEYETARIERRDEYRGIMRALETDRDSSVAHDLPDGVREAIEAWTKG